MKPIIRCSREGGKEEEETPQYEVVCSPTKCPPITRHPLPAIPSPPGPPTEGVDLTDEAVYEPIPGDK